MGLSRQNAARVRVMKGGELVMPQPWFDEKVSFVDVDPRWRSWHCVIGAIDSL